MSVRLSEIPSYLEYGQAVAAEDWEAAIAKLQETIRAVKAQDPNERICHLLEMLGESYAAQGEPAKGLECFEQAEREDPQWLYPKYETAVFLAKHLKRYIEAIHKCDEIMATLQGGRKRDDEFPEDYYVCHCLSLKAFCLYFLERKPAALELLRHIALLEKLYSDPLAFNLVERFLEEGVFLAECLVYLEKLKAQLSRNPPAKYSEEEMRYVEHLIGVARTRGK